MRTTRLFLLLLLALSLCGSCTTEAERRQMERIVAEADSMNRNYVPMTTDSLLLQACRYYDRHGQPNERMRAHYLLGCAYRDMGEAPRAIDAYQEAAACADTLAEDCDYYIIAAIYGQMAELFHAQFLPDDEIVALKSLAKMSLLDKDTLNEIIAIYQLSRPYFMRGDTDSVLIVEKQAHELFHKYGYKHHAAQAILASIRIELNRHNISEAEKLLNIYRNESGLFDNDGDLVRASAYYVDKGIYMMHVGTLDSAQYYFRKAVRIGFYEGGYRGLLSVYEKMDLPDSIAKYARLFAAANDSSFLHVNQESVHRISSLYNYTRQQKIAEEQAAKARVANTQKRILTMSIILLIVVFCITAKRWKSRAKRKYLKLSKAYDKSKAELAAALDRQQLLRYDYEEALRGKEEEQQQLLVQIQEDIQQKESEIELLKKRAKKQEEQLRQLSSVDMETAFKESDIYRVFYERKNTRYVLAPPSEEDWHELTELFRTHFVRFNTFITYEHRLSVNQYRYCVLLRLGFDNTDIGILMNKDKDQRHHLRKFICEELFGQQTNVKNLEALLKEHF